MGRLHLEKSFEIAVKVADQFNYRILSDRIEDARVRKFSTSVPDDDEIVEDSFGTLRDDFDHESSIRKYDEATESKRISPDFDPSRRTKRPLDEASDNGTPSPRQVKSRTNRFEREGQEVGIKGLKKSNSRQINPFAKKRIESPAKPTSRNDLNSPKRTPSKVALSRSSTFSAQSRQKSKVNRRIM